MRRDIRRSGMRRSLRIAPWMVAAAVALVPIALIASGVVNLATFGFGRKQPSHKGLFGLPAAAVVIAPYTRITRDHLWDATKSELAVLYLPPRMVRPEFKRSLGEVLGRVLAHEKRPGYVFTEDDFLPVGTRPGLVAGIPAGKRAIRVEGDRVRGLYGLALGDAFDLVATQAIDAGHGLGAMAGPYAQQLDLQARMSNWQKQATVRVLVQNGIVVEPFRIRQVPVSSSSLTQGVTTRTKPVQESLIAVDPEEVARLTEAMAVGAEISCIPRSGQPGDPNERTPELRPWSPFTVGPMANPGNESLSGQTPLPRTAGAAGVAPLTTIETISGTKREFVAAPVRQ